MTQAEQKKAERRTLDSVLAALGLQPSSGPVEGETPDFTFVHSNRTFGVEITMYRSGETVKDGLQRRQLESEWESLEAASKAFRNERSDIKEVNVVLYFNGPVTPKRQQPEFMEEIASFIRAKKSQLNAANTMFGNHTFTTPLMKKYLDTLYLRNDKYAIWHSNLVAGFIARPGPRVAEIVAEKSQKSFRPADELWLVIQASHRISELISTVMGVADFIDVPSLDDYKFSKVFVLSYNGTYEWSRGNAWRKLTRDSVPETKPPVDDLKAVLTDPEWLTDPDGKADRIAANILAKK